MSVGLTFAFPGLQRSWGDNVQSPVKVDVQRDSESWLKELTEDLEDDIEAEKASLEPIPLNTTASSFRMALPADLLRRVFRSLLPTDLARCEMTHRSWREIGGDEKLWRPLVSNESGSSAIDGCHMSIVPTPCAGDEEDTARFRYRCQVLQNRLWSRWHALWKGVAQPTLPFGVYRDPGLPETVRT